jgi:Asp-tRNA(Asn)/Glu-tRNA(Gln) amidotransferase C subunit
MKPKKKLESLDLEISNLNSELERVLASLKEMKAKQIKNSSIKDEAIKFIDKTEKLIQLAEAGKLKISPEEKDKLTKALSNIVKIFK